MKCKYQNCDCRYQKDIGRGQIMQTIPCGECELYDPHNPVTGGCLQPTGKIAVAIIIILIILLW